MLKYEVKYDNMASKTNNIFIESVSEKLVNRDIKKLDENLEEIKRYKDVPAGKFDYENN